MPSLTATRRVGVRLRQSCNWLLWFVLLVLFIAIQLRVSNPLMPLGLFRRPNVAIANVLAALWAASMFAWMFIAALYLQLVLGYSLMQVGLAFLPTNLLMAIFSLGLSAKLITWFGIKLPLVTGMLLTAVGFALFARVSGAGNFALDVVPSMLLLGLGAGIVFNPMLLAAMNDVAPNESGLASGLVNTSFTIGSALGLAVFASLAAARTSRLQASGETLLAALNGGYQLAFLVCAALTVFATLLGALLLRINTRNDVSNTGIALGSH